jgi:hypothetical protein
MRTMLAILLAAGLAAAPPAAADGPRYAAPGEVWATVNVCDTEAHPNEIGIRGGMEGLARRTRMFMRFRVQYRASDGTWRLVEGEKADSGWRKVASGRRGEHDAGHTFSFDPPTTGGAFVMRGVVRFEWRRGGRVVERERAITKAGHPGTAGADPADFSAATCWIA